MGPLYELPARYRRLCKKRGKRTFAVAEDLPPPLALSAGMAARSAPLSRMEASHLTRRAGFGGNAALIKSYVGMHPADAAQRMVDEAVTQPPPPQPPWATTYPPWDGSDAELRAYFDMQFRWFRELVTTWIDTLRQGGLREKLTLFWHDHFATERDTYFFTILALDYLTLLRKHALGSFKDLVIKVGINPAMLIYLDGRLSTRQEPNENYARELLELFTMGQYDQAGQSNYTQQDIVELSRCLTGYQVDYRNFSAHLSWNRTDHGVKTLFGRHGNFNFGGVHTVIFEERRRQIAEFMAAKLYTEFIFTTPHPDMVRELANTFEDNDFKIAPVVQALLASEHFYAPETMGAKLKSPVEYYVGFLADTATGTPDPAGLRRLHNDMGAISQRLLNPPNVAGWPGYRSWVSSSSLLARWQGHDYMLSNSFQFKVNVVGLARDLVDAADPLAVFKVPTALAAHLLSVPLDTLVLDAPAEFSGDLQTYPIPDEVANGPQYVRDLAKIFLAGLPWYEWNLESQGIAWGVRNYVQFLAHLPEFQLA